VKATDAGGDSASSLGMTTALRHAHWLLALALTSGCSTSSTTAAAAPTTTAATAAALPATDADRDLHLQGALNARDLGGLQGSRGPVPADRVIRTAQLSKLTDTDKDALVRHQVKLDLDLRTSPEVRRQPDAIASDPRFAYDNISLVGAEETDLGTIVPLGNWYVRLLAEKQPELRRIFQRIAAQRDGAVLVHCTAGKDRTGVVVAILLDLAGVDRAAIVQNYSLTAQLIQPMARPIVARDPKLAPVLESPPEAMTTFLVALDGTYGGARGYLHTLRLSDADIAALSTRMGQ
jgi:protein-tyrosine phosphatase